MTDNPTGTGFDGLKDRKADHLLDLERAKAAKKVASQGGATSRPSTPAPRQSPPSPSAHTSSASRQPAQAPPPSSTSTGGWWLLGSLVAIVAISIALTNSPSSSSSSAPAAHVSAEEQAAADATAAAGSTVQPIEAHVIAERANLRTEASARGAIVAELDQMQLIYVIGKEGTWSRVVVGRSANSVEGYISSKLLLEGNAKAARSVVCDVANSSIPYSGEILTRSDYGNNRLTVNAGRSDVLIKLRQGRQTALAFYVRTGEQGIVSDIPDGTYQVMFATGDGFSRKCLEFVNSMSVSADPNSATFETKVTSDEYNQYTQNTAAEYTLTRQTGGNFIPATVDESAFRE